MITLETLREHWKPVIFHIYRDDFTPDDHFIAQATIENTRIYYLLQGEWGDRKAPVIGSYEFPPHSSGVLFHGNGVRGGATVGGNVGFLWAKKLVEIASQS